MIENFAGVPEVYDGSSNSPLIVNFSLTKFHPSGDYCNYGTGSPNALMKSNFKTDP